MKDDDLLTGLTSLGCSVTRVEGIDLVALPDGFGDFAMDRQGEMLYVGATFLAPDEFADSNNAGTLYRFLLELQDRSLGCHFSRDRMGFLTIGTDLFPGQQKPNDVFQAMEQIAYVTEVCIHMCDAILDTGEIPPEDEVDLAFGLSKNLH